MVKLSVRGKLVTIVCANERLSRNVCLTILAKNQIFLKQERWEEIRKKTPWETMNMDRKTEVKKLL